MKIKLMMDGSLDVPPTELVRYDIPVVEPVVIIGEQDYISRVTITLDEFFERQRTSPVLPKSSQPSPGQFTEAFEKALQTHDHILCLSVSSGLSGTYNSIIQAADIVGRDKVTAFDTHSISAGGGMMVLAAARALAGGATLEQTLAAVRQTQAQTDLYFTVDDLTYLIKGGRIGRVQGAIGSFLNIKPIIMVDKSDGKLHPHSRIRSFKATMSKLVDIAVEKVGADQPGRFIILHGTMPDEANILATQLRQQCDVRYLEITNIGPTLGVHTGPKALGLAVAKGDF